MSSEDKEKDHSHADADDGDFAQEILENEEFLFESALLSRALSGGNRSERVGSLVQANFCTVTIETEITLVTSLFSRSKVAFILDEEDKLVDIITRIDLIDYISKKTGGVKWAHPMMANTLKP